MINYDFNQECCGCSACIDACPKRCIKQTTNQYGFIVPEVDASVCIDCHLCEKVCPVLKPEQIEYNERKLFSAINKNEEQRAAGSSGSVFYLLAEKTFEEGGVVFGAAFNDKFQLRHTFAENLQELRPLLKSKYLQSNTQGIYLQVKEQLNIGRKVLFVGTPCQCNALYKFLGNKKPENLLMADFICHGVPSQELFNKSISHWEKKNNCKIEQFEFRHKRPDSVHSFYLKAKGMNTDAHNFEMNEKFFKFPFYNAFKKYICFRESCYNCNFCREDRVADITLADFWHINEIDSTISKKDFNKGISMIIVNSAKGNLSLTSIADKVDVKEYSIEIADKCNFSYLHKTKKGLFAKWFFHDYNRLAYPELEKKHMRKERTLLHKVIILAAKVFRFENKL